MNPSRTISSPFSVVDSYVVDGPRDPLDTDAGDWQRSPDTDYQSTRTPGAAALKEDTSAACPANPASGHTRD